MLKPGFFTNEHLLELPFEFRLLFAGLWCHADRKGRLEDRPKRLRMLIFPADDVNVEAGLEALASHGFIQRYEVAGKRYISIVKFLEHQKPHMREAESTIPDPPFSEQKPRSTTKVGAEHSLGDAEPGGDLGLGTGDLVMGTGDDAPLSVVPFKPLISGSDLRRHGQHAWCDYGRNLCVTPWVHNELVGKVGGDPVTAAASVKKFYEDTIAALGQSPVTEPNTDKWWRAQFAAFMGHVPNERIKSKTELSLEAGRRVLARLGES